MRAKHEYGRIVEGARQLAKSHHLYFITITMPGTNTLIESEDKYLAATHQFLDAFRLHVKRAGAYWSYASVTERQPKRQHPHSHYLTTFGPSDAFYILEDYERYKSEVAAINREIPLEMRFSPMLEEDIPSMEMFSRYMTLQAVKSGLGVQCRISAVDQVEGVSRYIAKYLFKDMVATKWPKSWRRVRYSQNWPKLPKNASTTAFPVIRAGDWRRVAMQQGTVETADAEIYELAMRHLCLNVRCTVENAFDLPPP